MKTPVSNLSIYLIKQGFSEFQDILARKNSLEEVKIKDVGSFYYGTSSISPPPWLKKFFLGKLDGKVEKILSASSKAILLVRHDSRRIFAIPFGYGWTLLEPGVWEERFGLKVALGIIEPELLRKIEKKNFAHVPKDTSEQLSKAGSTADFSLDFEQDLIRSVTGKTKQEKKEIFGKTIAGKDALSLSVKVNIETIQGFLTQVYKEYESKEYKQSFGWIDHVSEVRDSKILSGLNSKLIETIQKENFDKVWMAVPELVDWSDVGGFSYNSRNKEDKDDVSLDDFMSSLSEQEKENLSIDTFNKPVLCLSESRNDTMAKWKAYNCLYCEVSDSENGKTHLLSNGNWYEVEHNFVQEVERDYTRLIGKESSLTLPDCRYKNERDYNFNAAEKISDLYCMDGQNISHGAGRSKIEFCDLYSKKRKQIIHIKRYGASSVLSHLFFQGLVSGETMKLDVSFRQKVNEKLPQEHKFMRSFESSEHQIIFGIISDVPEKLNIPFFSKVALKNVVRKLQGYGYKVFLQKVLRKTEALC